MSDLDPESVSEPEPCPDLETLDPGVLMNALSPLLSVGAKTEASLGMPACGLCGSNPGEKLGSGSRGLYNIYCVFDHPNPSHENFEIHF